MIAHKGWNYRYTNFHTKKFSVNRENYFYGDISSVIYVSSGSTNDLSYDSIDIECCYATELRDQGQYHMDSSFRKSNQAASGRIVCSIQYAGLIIMTDQVFAGRCDSK